MMHNSIPAPANKDVNQGVADWSLRLVRSFARILAAPLTEHTRHVGKQGALCLHRWAFCTQMVGFLGVIPFWWRSVRGQSRLLPSRQSPNLLGIIQSLMNWSRNFVSLSRFWLYSFFSSEMQCRCLGTFAIAWFWIVMNCLSSIYK